MPLQEPLITWNLFFSALFFPLCLFLLGWYLTKRDKKREMAERDRQKVVDENRILKEKQLLEWQHRFTDTQCSIKNTVEIIKSELTKKVSISDCRDEQKEVWDAINVLRDRFYQEAKEGHE